MGIALPAEFWPFMLASLIIELTPGPNMAWLAILAITEGRWRGLQAVAGVALGLALLGAAGAFGVTSIIQSSDTIYQLLRWAGIAFLVYLAWEGWRGEPAAAGDEGGDRRAFLRGLFSNMLNPKAAVFYMTVLPAFVVPAQPASTPTVSQQTWMLTAGYVVTATLVHAAIVLAAGQLRPFLVSGPRETRMRRALALALLATALWFAWTTRR